MVKPTDTHTADFLPLLRGIDAMFFSSMLGASMSSFTGVFSLGMISRYPFLGVHSRSKNVP